MSLRRPVRCALSLVVALTGLAGLFLRLGAQFVGFAQVLVYVGAVAILVVFAILLTNNAEIIGRASSVSAGSLAGLGIAAAVFACLAGALAHSGVPQRNAPPAPTATVRDLGARLMEQYILPLEVLGLLLTAAMIGAVVIALHERRTR
jgi:NADH-quinone oxidoreductase subunit J